MGPFAEKGLHKPLGNSRSRFKVCAWVSMGCEPCTLALPHAGLCLALVSISEMMNASAKTQPVAEQPRGVCHQQTVRIPSLHTGGDAPLPGAMALHEKALLFYFLHKTPRNTVLAESAGALILIPRHLGQSAVFLMFSIGFGLG